ncbi:pseudouridylate synthase 1 [Plasmodium gonderi]|uniref:Pseudouridylate synthase 1 n=1 Tax=Plasmodium gonderi TaxID=77519 RepID=A0A1Y1J909_PLAGO|nr:pseudouridylate synthase 1 [Plasmodium gonderi]GAW78991.1 pseudouridylate synthase 1 [Plasmodium gonderi]
MNNYQKNKERIKRIKLEEVLKKRAKNRLENWNNETNENKQKERHPNLKKYALCIGYVGTRYHGCQGQGKDCMTIENEIERTLIKMNAVKRNGMRKDFNFCLSRSARTDLGVHALYNVFVYNVDLSCVDGAISNGAVSNGAVSNGAVSNGAVSNGAVSNGAISNGAISNGENHLDAIMEERRKKEAKFIQVLNLHFPNDIRCFDMFKVTKSFDARKFCSFRLYEYLFPVSVLSEVDVHEKYKGAFNEVVDMMDRFVKEKRSDGKVRGDQMQNGEAEAVPRDKAENETVSRDKGEDETVSRDKVENETVLREEAEEDIFTVKEEKGELTEEELNTFFDIFKNYTGYHNFHCFTKNKIEQTTYRYIKYLDVSTVKLFNYNFVSLKILGQSFLMHQIRKMITLSVETFRKATSMNSIYYCLNSKEYIPISLFPADGLMLICPYFNSYNEKTCNPPQSPQIIFQENEKILKFKEDMIAKCVIQKMENNVWKEWILRMNKRPFVYHFLKDKIGKNCN